jgi:hypothetical protein
MVTPVNCSSCSAPISGLICEHCGKLAPYVTSLADENRALDQFNHLLHQLADDSNDDKDGKDNFEENQRRIERAEHLLHTGFIPDHKEVLIEAGIYCLPFLKSYIGLEDAALSRLDSIITKLKLMPEDAQINRAIDEFQSKIKEFEAKRKRENLWWGGGCVFFMGLIALLIVWLASRC